MKTTALIFLFPLCTYCQEWFTTNQNADLMISGVDFNNCVHGLLFNHPTGLASNGKNLVVCDRFNNRVLIWNSAPTQWDTHPDIVIGQHNFSNNNPGTEKDQLNWPGNVSVGSNGVMAIADTENNRILLWKTFPQVSGESADVSIYLPILTPKGSMLRYGWPWGVWTDGVKLAVVATHGAAILFWNSIPIQDNQPPDYILTNVQFGTPRNISSDGETYFFVGDHNAKVKNNAGTFFWNSYPKTENTPYDFYRDEWIKGTHLSNGNIIASGLQHIYVWKAVPKKENDTPDYSLTPTYYQNGDGVDVVEANGYIYVCNYNGNNILVYNKIPQSNSDEPLCALGVENHNNNSLDSFGYVQNPVMCTDGEKFIVSSDFDRRIHVFNNSPIVSGQKADAVYSTTAYNSSPWDNVCFNNMFITVGKNSVYIWNSTKQIGNPPSRTLISPIGNAGFNDLKGVALDSSFFYLADRDGKVYIWDELPQNNSVNPKISLNFPNAQLNRLSSDGKYFCVTQQSPAMVYIYRVSDLKNNITNPWKTISGINFLNLPSEAITFNGALAIANQSFHNVLLWKDINDAPSAEKMIVLGQSSNSPDNTPAIGKNRLFMPGSLLYENHHLWVGEHKFSSRIVRFSYNLLSMVNETIDENKINICPNPADESITINFTFLGNKKVDVYDFLGNQVRSIHVNSDSISISTQDLHSGLFYVVCGNMRTSFVKL